jgi:hypothetical protein
MSPQTEDEFNRGSGGELRVNRTGGQPKMLALHSSSVLACNVFDHWRASADMISKGLGIGQPIQRLTFEAQFPTGLPGKPPNIDVALWLESGEVWAIESKFTEPFGAQKTGSTMKDKYFPKDRPIWNDYGLPQCGRLAVSIRTGAVKFRHLDAAQLLKHALGLQVNHRGHFTLCYLYVDSEMPESTQHCDELAEFAKAINSDFPFVHVSYKTFLKRLRDHATGNHDAYFEYITNRYGFATR